MFMDRHYVQQVCPFFATKFSLHERSRDSPFNTSQVRRSSSYSCLLMTMKLIGTKWNRQIC
jgi:hypothetical protein